MHQFLKTSKADNFFNRENKSFFQAKLSINQPNDVYEQEADAMADKVMRMKDDNPAQSSFFKPSAINVQRKCHHCKEEEKKQLQRKEINNDETVTTSSTENYISSINGKGRSLSTDERKFFEPRFGYDFSSVQLHTNAEANQSAKNINALAYTHQNNIVFNANQYQPNNNDGKKLLAHELTHVVQQQSTSINRSNIQRAIPRSPSDSRSLTPYEAGEAHKVFGSALDTSDVRISEGSFMSVGGFARTLYNHIYFPGDSFNGSGFMPWLIHELTHVWQYQRGADFPGMIWEAVVGIYDYGGEPALLEDWENGKAFDEYTTEQQGDILEDYYKALISNSNVSAFQPFVDQVRTGNEKVHRYKGVKPLDAPTLDIDKLNNDYRLEKEKEIISVLKSPVTDDSAIIRAEKIIDIFKKTSSYWYGTYCDRFIARKSDDELINLIFSKLSKETRIRIYKIIFLDKQYWK